MYIGLAVVTIAPSRAMASTAIAYSGVLGLKMAQTSPLPQPAPRERRGRAIDQAGQLRVGDRASA